MEENDEDTDKGGGEDTGVRIFLQSRCPVGVSLLSGDMGGYPPHGTVPGGFTRPGGAATTREASTEEAGWDMGVHLGGGGKIGGGVLDDGDLHLAKAEYGRTVYCDTTDSGPVQGGGEEAGGTGRDTVVGTGGD